MRVNVSPTSPAYSPGSPLLAVSSLQRCAVQDTTSCSAGLQDLPDPIRALLYSSRRVCYHVLSNVLTDVKNQRLLR